MAAPWGVPSPGHHQIRKAKPWPNRGGYVDSLPGTGLARVGMRLRALLKMGR